jgi:hypothetical protein
MISVKVSWLGRVLIVRPTSLELVALFVVLFFIGTVILFCH